VAIIDSLRAFVNVSTIGVVETEGANFGHLPESRFALAREGLIGVDAFHIGMAIVRFGCWERLL
jgi:hypothetical protein